MHSLQPANVLVPTHISWFGPFSLSYCCKKPKGTLCHYVSPHIGAHVWHRSGFQYSQKHPIIVELSCTRTALHCRFHVDWTAGPGRWTCVSIWTKTISTGGFVSVYTTGLKHLKWVRPSPKPSELSINEWQLLTCLFVFVSKVKFYKNIDMYKLFFHIWTSFCLSRRSSDPEGPLTHSPPGPTCICKSTVIWNFL